MRIITGETGRAKLFAHHDQPGKICSYCNTAAAILFCLVDSAFLCISCDSKLHAADTKLLHERVWICEVCEQAPAAVTCKADAAAICAACDGDIHSANSLAGRHERVPVVPFYDTAEKLAVTGCGMSVFDAPPRESDMKLELLPPDSIVSAKPTEFMFPDSEQENFLDFDHYHMLSSQPFSDSLVPAKQPLLHHDFFPENGFKLDFTNSRIACRNFHVSPSMDYGVVPDSSSMSEISYPFSNSRIDVPKNEGSQPHAICADREAKVLRYKEKKKNRKFEKTIRYASRKAYAEARPRIKGRFVKRSVPAADEGPLIFADPAGYGYGVVPSF